MPDNPGDWVIAIDRYVCMGSGMCVVYAPETFAHDDEAKAFVADPTGNSLDTIRVAVEACPTGALTLTPQQRGM